MSNFDLGTYGAEIVLDDSQFNRGMKNAEDSMGKTEKKTQSFGKRVGKIALGAVAGLTTAIVGAGAAGIAMANNFADTADEIDKSAIKMGISTDAFQELRFAMGQVGVSQGTMDKSLQRLNQRLADTDGNEKYRTALENLGVATEDAAGKTRSADDVFMDSIQALHEMEDASQQAAIAQEIFGTKTAQDLLPAITAGGEEIANLRGEAHELGAVISEDGVQSGVLWADTMDKFKNMMSGVWASLAQELLPAFQGFLDWVMDHMPTIQSVIQTVFDVIRTVIGTAIKWIGNIITWLKTWFDNNQETLKNIKNGFMDFVEVVINLFKGFVEFATAIWERYGETILNFIKTTFENIRTVISGLLNVIKGIIKTVTGIITGDWSKAWEGIKQIFSGVWEVMSGTVKQVINFIKSYIQVGLTTASNIVKRVTGSIKNFFSSAWNSITNGAKKFKSVFVNIWKGIQTGIKAVINPITGFINGLIGGMESMVNAIGKAINSLPSFDIPKWVPIVGGNTFGLPKMPTLSIPKIPALATGGVVSKPTLAMVGDAGVGNPEIVAPQKMLSNLFSEALNKHGGQSGDTDNSIHINIENIHGTDRQSAESFSHEVIKRIRKSGG